MMSRIGFVLFLGLVCGASATNLKDEEAKEPQSKFIRPGVWFPLNIPSPAATVPTTANVCTGCCMMQCVGGTCAAPTTCTPATPAATACFATTVSATCSNIAACKLAAAAPCTSTTADCVSTQVCPVAAG